MDIDITKDYYKILNVEPNATGESIKKSYRQLQMKHHPDKDSNNNNDICSEINNAYEILSDPKKRSHYDMLRNSPFMNLGNPSFMGGMAGMTGMGGMSMNGNINNPQDIQNLFTNIFAEALSSELEDLMFNSLNNKSTPNIHIFGTNTNPQDFMNRHNINNINNINKKINKQPNQIIPEPIEKTITITLEQSFTGCNIPVNLERVVILNKERKKENETIYVNIEKGIDNDEIINIEGKGHNINNIKGSVKLFIKVKNNTHFERDGLNLIYNKTLNFKESLCGFSFDLEHIDGRSFTLNSNGGNIVYNNYKKVIPKLGFERKENLGNLIIKFMVSYPEKLTNEQIEKLREIL